MAIIPVVKVDDDKCVNCHQCISVCPVKFCQDGSGEAVKIIDERCIGCGSCIIACDHDARIRLDDWDNFITAVNRNEKIVAIIAPSAAASFEGDVLRLNGFLKSLGIEAFFDVSFGAELTIQSYLEYINKKNPETVISQPCPAIVNYIELYKPQLIPHLAPADSPMLHTIKMIKTYYNKYKNHRIAVISPCIAKRVEFENTGIGDFNITFTAIEKYLEEKGVDLKGFDEVQFDSPVPERAVLFSTPGGLKATLEREAPKVLDLVRKIEGTEIIYDYLDEFLEVVKKGVQPLLVDCLNCEKGCNGGTGTSVQNIPVDFLENAVQKRSLEARKSYSTGLNDKTARRKMKKIISKYWKPGLYDRTYVDRSHLIKIKEPDKKQKWEIFNKMMKYSEDDVYNCTSCGYGACDDMAKAIFNGLNKPENCHHFELDLLEQGKEKIIQISDRLHQKINNANELMKNVETLVVSMMQGTAEQSAAVEESSAAVEQMIASIQSMNHLVKNRHDVIRELQEESKNGSEAMIKTVSSVQQVFEKVDKIKGVNQTINDVASNTNLLAMNAAIEAAHAGNSGKGFAVVADEIRKLAEQTADNAKIISTDLLGIARDVQETKDVSQETGVGIQKIVVRLTTVSESFEELSVSMEQMASGSNEIQTSLEQMQISSHNLKDFGNQVNLIILDVTRFYDELHQISEENLKAL